jgi:hypothetical protein
MVAALGLGVVAVTDASARQPALDQYVPSLPGAAGNQGPRLGGAARPEVLPAAVRARLAHQRDGSLLLRIATAPGLGAPADHSTRRPARGSVAASASASPDGFVSGAVRAAAREPAVLALLGGVLLSTCVLLGLAHAQRRRL